MKREYTVPVFITVEAESPVEARDRVMEALDEEGCLDDHQFTVVAVGNEDEVKAGEVVDGEIF